MNQTECRHDELTKKSPNEFVTATEWRPRASRVQEVPEEDWVILGNCHHCHTTLSVILPLTRCQGGV